MPPDADNRPAAIAVSVDPVFAEAGIPVHLDCAVIDITGPLTSPLPADRLVETAANLSIDASAVASLPTVAATRAAYRALGKDPARYRPSSEALLRRIAQSKPLPRVNALVDAGNLASVRTALPIGFYDIGKLRPPVRLRCGAPGETYDAIGRGPMNLAGLPLLADADGPFGSPTSDSQRTSVQDGAVRALFVVFCFGNPGSDDDALTIVGDAIATAGVGRLTGRWSVTGGIPA